MAIDIIYTLAAVLKDVLVPFKAEILEVLNHSRFDKCKPVREATIEAYHTIKSLGGDDEGFEEEEPSYSNQKPSAKTRPSLKETIKQAKKGKAQTKDMNFEILDKSDNDRKLSAATQKRIENKRATMVSANEEKKDTAPISYDDVKSHIFEGPKNRNFFKTQKSKKKDEIEIFTAGDRSKFDYEADLKKHQEQDARARQNQPNKKVKENNFFDETEDDNQNRPNRYSERSPTEDRKVAHDDKPIGHGGIKAPDDVPIQIYVKGNPKKKQEDDSAKNSQK